MKELLYLKPYLYKYRKSLILGSLFILISNIFAVYIPQFVGQAFNEIEANLSKIAGNEEKIADFTTSLLHYGAYVLLFALAKGFFMVSATK